MARYGTTIDMELPRRGSAWRYAPRAAFVSQVLADRQAAAPRAHRAPLDAALSAYASGALIAVRRLPAGYRRTLDV